MQDKFKIDGKEYSTKKILVIAEACDNHFGSIEKAFKMIDLAKYAGANVIKFQHHLPDEEMLKIVPKSSNFKISLYDFLKKYSLKLIDHYKLKKYCEKKKITYLCTPFSLKAAEELNKLNVCGFKIGSGEMSDHPTIKEIVNFNKPLIVSTGMSTEREILDTYKIIIKNKKSTALMNCLSEYPTDYNDLNLGYIKKMKNKFPKTNIGHSDHTSGNFTSIAAITLGATIIEKHVTLDKKYSGPDKDVSIDFKDLSNLIKEIRLLEKSLGDKKFIHKKEIPIRKWAHRSIVTIKKIKKGEKISLKNIWSKRPGTGIPSKFMSKVLGKVSSRNLKENKLLLWKDLVN